MTSIEQGIAQTVGQTYNGRTVSNITGMRVCFILWGILGFLVACVSILDMVSQRSVGVGTSAFVAAGLLFWIGGMVFFGLGDLLAKIRHS